MPPTAPARDRRFEIAWYAQAMLRQLVLIYPTMAIMMLDAGIAAASLAALYMIWSAAALVFEVPTGVLADRMPRRTVLMLAGLVKGSAFAVWWLLPGFWGYALGFVVMSLGSALRSGASEAFLHDTLTSQGRPHEFERIYGREQAAATAGVAAALLTGGWVAESGFALPLVLSVLAPWAATLVVAVWLEEPPAATAVESGSTVWDTFAASVREIAGQPLLKVLVAMMALLPTVYGVLEEFVGPLFDELRFSLTGVGVVYGLAFLVQAAAVAAAHRWRALSLGRLCGLFAAGGGVLAAGVVAGGYLAAGGLWIYFALSGIAGVLLQGRLQGSIRSPARATITSTAGLLQQLFSLALYLAIGLAAQWLDWRLAVAGIGVWLTLSALVFALAALPHMADSRQVP